VPSQALRSPDEVKPDRLGQPIESPAGRAALWPLLLIGVILFAFLVKIGFLSHLGGRMYGDTSRALNFAVLVTQGPDSIRSSIINDKTFIGPMLWYGLYRQAGVAGLLTFNLISFLALCAVGYRLGRNRYDGAVRAIAMLLFACYVGTHRNIVAGEPDDNLAALLFAFGILAYLDKRRAFVGGLLIGIGFLFKFWIPIFALGFAIYLIQRRLWRDLGWALIGMALPFLVVNCIDGLASLHGLLFSIGFQYGYSSWTGLVFKLFSTGLLPIPVITTMVWWKRRSDVGTLFWLLSIAYPAYAVLNRDAYAASYVLMLTMVFASFPLAEALLAIVGRLPSWLRSGALAGMLAVYLVGTTVVAYHNLYRDTAPITFGKDPAQARKISKARFVGRTP
jgi:hypothetical protein